MNKGFLYDISKDFEIGQRIARLLETKKRFRSDIKKEETSKLCLQFSKRKGKQIARLSLNIIHKNNKKSVFYLVQNRLGDKDSLDGEAYEICKPEPRRF